MFTEDWEITTYYMSITVQVNWGKNNFVFYMFMYFTNKSDSKQTQEFTISKTQTHQHKRCLQSAELQGGD